MNFGVASLAEAWIEISVATISIMSPGVASLAEAWIEIKKNVMFKREIRSRFPRGSVD